MICKICNKEFTTVKEVSKHLAKDHGFNASQIYKYFNYSFETGNATCPICGKEFVMTKRQMDGFKKNPNKSIGCCTTCSKAMIMVTHECPLSKDDVKKKIKNTMINIYGVDHPMKSQKIKIKLENTNMDKYGVKNTFQVKEFREKAEQTNLKKYGTKYAIEAKEVRDKAKETVMNNFGVDNVFKAEEVKEKIRQTHIKNKGVDHPMKSIKSQQKMRETNLEKRGVEYPLQSAESRAKMRNTNIAKHGVACSLQIPELVESNREKAEQTSLERHGVKHFCQHEKCYGATHMRISKINKKFQEVLNENNISSELEFIVNNNGYDIKVGDTLIEINPSFTHNSTIGPRFGNKNVNPKPTDYHFNKTRIALESGFNCIHVFDWDDINKIIGLLKGKTKLFARNCVIKEINTKEVNKFLEDYHLQGSTRSVKHAYGLLYKNELVEVMTFGKPRYNKNYEYELLRLCTSPDYKVVGGASKLLKYFEEQVEPKSIISYCDLSKFNGEVYEKLGFKLIKQTEPARHWYNPKTKTHITDNLLRQRGFDQLHKTNFGKGTSNEQLMLEHGYIEIYDCGQLVFVKKHN